VRTGSLDRALAQPQIALHVERRFEMQLPMKVSVIAELMALGHRAMHDVGPALSVSSKNEERCLNAELAERIENSRSCVGVWPIIERERNFALSRWQMSENRSEDFAVAVKRSVDDAARERQTDRRGEYHLFSFVGPSTPM
jgi:hypothetical protein